MADFKKLIEHPEKDKIIDKLVKGESPKDISAYLKDTYPKPDEGHLRLSAQLIQDFKDKYADHFVKITNIVSVDCDAALDKKIHQSLLNNSSWRDRIEKHLNDEIDFKQKLKNLMVVLEARAEQIFDLIQSNPEMTKADYVYAKYIELAMNLAEKADKIINEKPDLKIEHTYSVQMVEQQSVVFQEAIRRVLERMGPDYSSIFMDLLNEELSKLNPKEFNSLPQPKKEIEKERTDMIKMIDQTIEAELEIS